MFFNICKFRITYLFWLFFPLLLNGQVKGLYAFNEHRWKVGVMNENQKVILKPSKLGGMIDTLQSFVGVQLPTKKVRGTPTDWGVINSEGKLILDTIYQSIQLIGMPEQTIPITQVSIDKKFGLMDLAGNTLLPIEYDEIKETQKRIPFEYSHLAKVKKGNLTGIVHKKDGTFALPLAEQTIERFGYESLLSVAIFKKDEKYGAINSEGTLILPANYTKIEIINSYAPIQQLKVFEDINFFFVDAWGDKISDPKIRSPYAKKQYSKRFKKREQAATQKRTAPTEFQENIITFFETKAHTNGKASLIIHYSTPQNNLESVTFEISDKFEVLAPYISIEPATGKVKLDKLVVKVGEKLGICQANGLPLTPISFDVISDMETHFLLEKDNLKGYANQKGQLIFDAIFSEISKTRYQEKGLIEVTKGRYRGFADFKSKTIYLPNN